MAEEEMTSLDSLLSGDEPIEAPAAAPEPAIEAQPRDESGRFARKGEDEGASPAPVDDPPFDHAAVKGERSRRQAAESERDSLRAELDTLKQQFQAFQQPPAPPPSIWEDEQGAFQHNNNQVVSQASFNARLDMSEMLASQAHEDFDAMKAKFLEMMAVNPALQQQALSARHPWEHAYQTAKNAARFEEMGATNVDELRAKLREELMAEMQAQPMQTRPSLPPTLTSERSVGARTGPAWSGPASLDELLR